jgi:hypothetical protein
MTPTAGGMATDTTQQIGDQLLADLLDAHERLGVDPEEFLTLYASGATPEDMAVYAGSEITLSWYIELHEQGDSASDIAELIEIIGLLK